MDNDFDVANTLRAVINKMYPTNTGIPHPTLSGEGIEMPFLPTDTASYVGYGVVRDALEDVINDIMNDWKPRVPVNEHASYWALSARLKVIKSQAKRGTPLYIACTKAIKLMHDLAHEK